VVSEKWEKPEIEISNVWQQSGDDVCGIFNGRNDGIESLDSEENVVAY